MTLPGLIEKVENYLGYLQEEGARRIEVKTMPRVQREQASFTASQSSKAKAAPTAEANTDDLPGTLQYIYLERLAECSAGPSLRVLGNSNYFVSPNRDLLDKMFYAIGYQLSEKEAASVSAEITLGQTAIDFVSGKKSPLLQKRGRWTKRGELPVIPTLGPDYLAMEPKAKADVWKDLLSVVDKLDIELPEWSAKYKK